VQMTHRVLTDAEITEKLKPHFYKEKAGEYSAHINGSDIKIQHMSTQKWKWSLSGRQSGHGWSGSLAQSRVDSWRHTLNQLELAAYRRGELSIP
jgi:hypothetical protein